jgi:hypothetical protein
MVSQRRNGGITIRRARWARARAAHVPHRVGMTSAAWATRLVRVQSKEPPDGSRAIIQAASAISCTKGGRTASSARWS